MSDTVFAPGLSSSRRLPQTKSSKWHPRDRDASVPMEISNPTRQRITVQSTGQGPCVPSRAWHGSPGTFLRSFRRPLLHVRTLSTQPDHRHKISTEPNQTGHKKRDSIPILPRNPCLCRAPNPVRPLSLTGGSARRPPRLSEPDPGPDPHA
jgi:hypothetical protein